MPLLLRLLFLSLLALTNLQAQDLEKVLPKPLPPNAPAKAPANPEVPEGPGGQDKIIERVRALVFVSSEAQIRKDGVPAFDGVRVGAGLPYLDRPDFRLRAEAFVGKPLTADTLNEITRAVVAQYVANDHPVVDAVVPEQNIGNGVIQVAVIEGRVHEVRAKGNKWFSGDVLVDELGMRRGDAIPQSVLVSRLNWMNQNPFRDVSAQFARGPEVGTTDIVLKTQDRFPVRFYTGYDNTGNFVTGQDRWNYGFNYGNFLGLDQQLNYQYTASSDWTRFNAHAGSYVVPLPWHHTLSFFGGYITTEGHPSGTNLNGTSWQASGRYTAGLPTLGNFTQ
ncbi:MAG TPA: ShlB/FhaC/HecB family hemolysin secretion/activation protein, partial [Candidatus Methylacidiphilales bacterium]